jgi:phosphoribosyl 1,2-cyclic phosphate phosphodiesterase
VQITFLGTGTSHGIPMIGCTCDVCLSADPRDKRLRPSIFVRLDDDTDVLVDTSADFRAQALTHDITHIDAVLYTHSHADHILGLDELRRYNVLQREAIPLYADERTLRDLRRVFDYAFQHTEGGHEYVPRLRPSAIAGPFSLGPTTIVPVPILHGARTILGYRMGRFAYLTDCSGVPETSLPLLAGLDLLVIGALRERPHPSHFSVSEAIEAARRIGATRTLFTHMCHDLGHLETCARLPQGIELAYDGQIVTLAPQTDDRAARTPAAARRES